MAFRHKGLDEETEEVARQVVDAAGAVRKRLGVGLQEGLYQRAFVAELRRRGMEVAWKPRLPVYDGEIQLPGWHEPDAIVGGRVVAELKAVRMLRPQDYAQTLTYVRAAKLHLGFLLNFHAVPLRYGIRRVVDWPKTP